jgi:type I restriction enzyme S subunit
MKKRWESKALGELCEIELGKTPARANASFWDDKRETGNVWLSIADLLKAEDNVVVNSKEYISDKGAAICKLVLKGTLLVSFKLTLGRLAFAGRDLFTNEAIAALTIFNERELSKEFLFYSLSFFDWVKAAENDVKLKGMTLNKAKLKVMPVSFPPLAEQQRIVGILDEAFAGIARAKANAEQNLQNARALFESHLQAVFSQRGEGWVQRRLGDLVTRLTNGYVGPTRNIYYDTGVPYLLARHVKDNRLKFDGKTFITDEFNRKNKKSILKAGDVLLVQSGHIGHSAVVTEEHVGHNCHAMIVITAVEGAFIGPFLSLFFNSSGMKQKFQEIRSGSTVPHLTCGEVKELMIPLPDLATQRRVVAHSQELNEETRSLARLYERKLAALEELKKSLLHQAFSGEL